MLVSEPNLTTANLVFRLADFIKHVVEGAEQHGDTVVSPDWEGTALPTLFVGTEDASAFRAISHWLVEEARKAVRNAC